jgi:hypothetical protein
VSSDVERLAAVAAFGLAGCRLDLPSEPLDEQPWEDLVRGVKAQRIVGFLLRAIESGAMAATPEQVAEAAELHLQAMHLVLLLERLTLETCAALEAKGIESRVLKGPALAHLAYPDPSLRCFGDVDVLVRPDDYDPAVEVLRSMGARRRFPEPRPGFDRRFGKGVSFATADGMEVDLHRTFVAGPFGLTVHLADLFETSSPFTIGGVELHGLGPEERFLHACYHAALGALPARLMPLRDVAQLLLEHPIDQRKVQTLAESWRAELVVASAIQLAWAQFDLADVVHLSVWAHGYHPRPAEQSALAAYQSSRRSYAGQLAAGLSVVPGYRAKGAYLRALLLPDAGYLDSREQGRVRRWRRALRVMRRGARR